MKRLVTLLLLFATVGFAEDATLSLNTVMRTDKALVVLKAGTVVHVISRGQKTIAVKVGDKTGLIPWTALEESDESMMMVATPPSRLTSPSPTPVRTSASVATANPPEPTTPPPPRRAQSMYGKMVEKARDNAGSHEKNLVNPADDVLSSK